MSDDTIVSFSDTVLCDGFTDLMRDCARRMLQTALNAEVDRNLV